MPQDLHNASSIASSHHHNKSFNNSRKSHTGVDISYLLIKSLIQFSEQKKIEKMIELSKVNGKKAKMEYLNHLNEQIRI